MNISCSNNKLAKDVLSGLKRTGTRYECLRKGFGEGYYNGKSDVDYTEEYEPITIDKFYCGTKLKLPEEQKKLLLSQINNTKRADGTVSYQACPVYDLTGLVKKTDAGDLCYGCGIPE